MLIALMLLLGMQSVRQGAPKSRTPQDNTDTTMPADCLPPGIKDYFDRGLTITGKLVWPSDMVPSIIEVDLEDSLTRVVDSTRSEPGNTYRFDRVPLVDPHSCSYLIYSIVIEVPGLNPVRQMVMPTSANVGGVYLDIPLTRIPGVDVRTLESVVSIDTLMRRSNSTVLNLVDSALTEQRKNNYKKAAADLQEALKIDPLCYEATLEMGLVEQHNHNYDKAEQLLTHALELNPASVVARVALGQRALETHNYDKAVQLLSEAVTYGATSPDGYTLLGTAQFEADDVDNAELSLQRALTINPNDARANHELYSVFIKRGQLDKALAVLQDYIERHPAAPDRDKVQAMVEKLKKALKQHWPSDAEDLRITTLESHDVPGIVGIMRRMNSHKWIARLAVVTATVVFVSIAAERTFVAGPPAANDAYSHGVVVSVDPIASNAGMEILKKGGNAVDAAVATGLALAVTHPGAGNLGGGGYMLIYLARNGGETVGIDYREKAPEKSTPTMFLTNGEVDPKKSDIGYLVIGVPGSVRGFWEASKRYGKLDWKTVVEPALKLARDGFTVDDVLARSLKTQDRVMQEYKEFARAYRKSDGTDYAAGDTMKLPDLAWTLQQIYSNGADGFYKGEVAKKLVDGLQAGGGIITLNDLANYDAKIRTPLRGTYRGYDIVGMPPSSSGGATVIQMLNVLEGFDLSTMARRDARTIHLLTETMRIGFYNRAKYLGDTDFVPVDLQSFTSKAFARPFHDMIDMNHSMSNSALGADIITRGEGEDTTHFSVADAEGNAVSNTFTIEQLYGSRVIAPGTGFLLNNEMHDFNMNPGVTDTKGLIGTKPNLIEPGKRMLSSMSPMIVLKDGKPFLITGSPGGRTIINTVLQMIVNVIDFKMDIQSAVDEPRIHHQWMPDTLTVERPLEPLTAQLTALGHTVRAGGGQGDAHSILIKDGMKYAGVDHRTRGGAAGY